MPDQSLCVGCLAPLVWGHTDRDRKMPLDSEPDANGNALLLPSGRIVVFGVLDATWMRESGHQLRLSHHASCPSPPPRRS